MIDETVQLLNRFDEEEKQQQLAADLQDASQKLETRIQDFESEEARIRSRLAQGYMQPAPEASKQPKQTSNRSIPTEMSVRYSFGNASYHTTTDACCRISKDRLVSKIQQPEADRKIQTYAMLYKE